MLPQIKDKISEYFKIKTDQVKLEVAGHISRITSMIIAYLFIAVFFIFFVLFISITLGVYLNQLLGSPYLGYLIISGVIFLKMILLFILLRTGKLETFLERMIVKSMKSEEKDD